MLDRISSVRYVACVSLIASYCLHCSLSSHITRQARYGIVLRARARERAHTRCRLRLASRYPGWWDSAKGTRQYPPLC